jgi:branched-chain amino acid transport system ATP-binding protein
MLKVTRLTKKFGELIAVDDLSFEVQKGQIYGIAGPNGAGKSTVFNLIVGKYGYEGIKSPKGELPAPSRFPRFFRA